MKHTLSIVFFLSVLPTIAISQKPVGIVLDKKTTQQVVLNSSSKIAVEELISMRNKESRELQGDVSMYVFSIERIQNSLQIALSNVKFFGEDSKNIIEIGKTSVRIMDEIKEITIWLEKNPKSALSHLKTLRNLTLETYSSINQTYSIIMNSTKRKGNDNGSNDGLNLLDPKDRLDLANHIIIKLRRIYNICVQMKINLQYCVSWGEVFQKFIPYDFTITQVNKEIANDIISKFK